MKKGRKGEKEDNEEEIVEDGSTVHIFGCINFPSEWRTFDGCVNSPNVQQLLQFRFCHCTDAMTFNKQKFCHFLESGHFLLSPLHWKVGKRQIYSFTVSSFTSVLTFLLQWCADISAPMQWCADIWQKMFFFAST